MILNQENSIIIDRSAMNPNKRRIEMKEKKKKAFNECLFSEEAKIENILDIKKFN